ncbi:glycosyltransferase family 4 protein [Weissella paramesenteroides]
MIMVATTASMIGQFNIKNIKLLLDMDYEVSVACNFNSGSSWNQTDSNKLKKYLIQLGVHVYNIPFSRSPFAFIDNFKAFMALNSIFNKNKFNFVHCHTPVGGVIARLVAKYNSVPSIYTAHGFHFFKGAPLKNWMLYYPIEKFLSRITNVLITINSQDFNIAKKKFYADKVLKIPGVGIDLKKFNKNEMQREKVREKLGISSQQIMILSVGELNVNKNQRIIIEALNLINDTNIKYFIVGIGKQEEYLKKLVNKYNLSNTIQFLGYRTDISNLDKATDIFVFPSYREGLGLSAIEAMASGAVLVTSNSGGIVEYSINGKTGYNYDPDDIEGFAKGIKKVAYNHTFREKTSNLNVRLAKKYSNEHVLGIMKQIYEKF